MSQTSYSSTDTSTTTPPAYGLIRLIDISRATIDEYESLLQSHPQFIDRLSAMMSGILAYVTHETINGASTPQGGLNEFSN